MKTTTAERNLESRALLFKVLGDPTRLLILNLIRMKSRHGEELATILGLTPATISHHLSRLTDVGLLKSRKDQYYHTYSLVGDQLQQTVSDVVFLPQPGLAASGEEDAYRAKVLKEFFRRGRLTRIPAQLKKRQIVLERLVEEFEPDRTYSEREVNLILLDFHEDVAYLRRGMISNSLMTRERGMYSRVLHQKNQAKQC